jgi:TonB family protein
MAVVMKHVQGLRLIYTDRLKSKPGLHGTCTIRYAINDSGRVIYCAVLKSTLGDEVLDTLVVQNVRQWQYPAIPKKGDVTEVIYPFTFAEAPTGPIIGVLLIVVALVSFSFVMLAVGTHR